MSGNASNGRDANGKNRGTGFMKASFAYVVRAHKTRGLRNKKESVLGKIVSANLRSFVGKKVRVIVESK